MSDSAENKPLPIEYAADEPHRDPEIKSPDVGRQNKLTDLSEFEKGGDPDMEIDKVGPLFNQLCHDYTEPSVFAYIEHHTEGTVKKVITEWLAGKRKPSRGLRKRVLKCLEQFDPKFIPAYKITKPAGVPMAPTENFSVLEGPDQKEKLEEDGEPDDETPPSADQSASAEKILSPNENVPPGELQNSEVTAGEVLSDSEKQIVLNPQEKIVAETAALPDNFASMSGLTGTPAVATNINEPPRDIFATKGTNDRLSGFFEREKTIYNFLLQNNQRGVPTHIDKLNFPKGYGFGRKSDFVTLLCNSGLMKGYGNYNYTLLEPEADYTAQIKPAVLDQPKNPRRNSPGSRNRQKNA